MTVDSCSRHTRLTLYRPAARRRSDAFHAFFVNLSDTKGLSEE